MFLKRMKWWISGLAMVGAVKAYGLAHLQKGNYALVSGDARMCDAKATLDTWINSDAKQVIQLGARFTYVWDNVHSSEKQDRCVYGTAQTVSSDDKESRLVLDATEVCPKRPGDSQRDILVLRDQEVDLSVRFIKPGAGSAWVVDPSQEGFDCHWKRLPEGR